MKTEMKLISAALTVVLSFALIISLAFLQPVSAEYDWSDVEYDFDDAVVMTPGVTRSAKFSSGSDTDWYVFEAAGGEYTVTVYTKTKYDKFGYGHCALPIFFSLIREIGTDGGIITGDPEESLGMFYAGEADVTSDGWFKATEPVGTFKPGTIVGIELENYGDSYPEAKVFGENPFSREYKVCINGKVADSVYKPGKTKLRSIGIGKGSLNIKWRKAAKASGYEVKCALNKKFTKGVRKATVKSGSTIRKKIKKLKKKKKYYVKVRAYRTANGKKYYSAWSSVKSVKTK